MEWAAILAVVLVVVGVVAWTFLSRIDEEDIDDDPYEGAFGDEDEL